MLLLVGGMAAGALNTLAGGGGLVTFPLLLIDLPAVTADATSGLALYPAYLTSTWANRAELRRLPARWWLLLGPCLAGGLLGAVLLRWAGNQDLLDLVPWLVGGSTLLILVRPLLARLPRRQPVPTPVAPARVWVSRLLRELLPLGIMFLVAVYGGFFGAGIGILMIGALGIIGLDNIHQTVALKNALSGGLRGVAVAVFILDGKVDWGRGLAMGAGAVLGGYLAAKVARRTNHRAVRALVLAVGFVLTIYYFCSCYGVERFLIGGE
jgi:uncharacterized membrane protein YfcA